MASNTTRLHLPYPQGGDAPPDVAKALRELSEQLDSITMSRGQGLFAERPPASTAGRMYWATDQAQMYFDDGETWTAMGPAVELPIGGVLDWPATTSPPGPATWLELNGGPITRADYPLLFTAWNLPGQSANLPDRRGRSPMGAGQGVGLTNRVVGTPVGEERVTLTTEHLPRHSHAITMHPAGTHNHTGATGYDGRHNHYDNVMGFRNQNGLVLPPGNFNPGNYWKTYNEPYYANNVTLTSDAPQHAHVVHTDGSHTHGLVMNDAGSGTPAPNVHPSAVTRYFVRAR